MVVDVRAQMLDQARVLLAAEDYEQAAKLYKRLAPVDTNFADAAYEFGVWDRLRDEG